MDTIHSKGRLEAAVSQEVIRLERELVGRGPLEARAYLVEDMVLVRLKGVLTVSERHLAASSDRGPELVRQMRQELTDHGRPLLEQALGKALGVPIRNVHTDICPRTDERILVFSLEGRPGAHIQDGPTRAHDPRPKDRGGAELTSPGHSPMILT